jgi:hypothetical protein
VFDTVIVELLRDFFQVPLVVSGEDHCIGARWHAVTTLTRCVGDLRSLQTSREVGTRDNVVGQWVVVGGSPEVRVTTKVERSVSVSLVGSLFGFL